MDKIRTGLRTGMKSIVAKSRSKQEEIKSNIRSSTGFSSAKNANSVSPYKDENQTPNKRSPGKRTPVIKRQKPQQNIPTSKVAATGGSGSPGLTQKELIKSQSQSTNLKPPTNVLGMQKFPSFPSVDTFTPKTSFLDK